RRREERRQGRAESRSVEALYRSRRCLAFAGAGGGALLQGGQSRLPAVGAALRLRADRRADGAETEFGDAAEVPAGRARSRAAPAAAGTSPARGHVFRSAADLV